MVGVLVGLLVGLLVGFVEGTSHALLNASHTVDVIDVVGMVIPSQ